MPIDNLTHVAARELTVFINFQFIGIDEIDAKPLTQVFAKECEAAAEDGYLIATGLEHLHQPRHPFGERQMLGNIFHYAGIQAFEQCHALGETLLEVNLTTHGALGDGLHFIAHPSPLGQFVNTLRLDERRIHIETDETPHAPEHIIALEREVDILILPQPHEVGLHRLAVARSAAQ